MTWTFTSTDVSGTSRDQIRTYIGDTDSSDQLLSDEQIALALTDGGGVKAGAAIAADFVSAKFARKADKSVGDLSISYAQMAKHYAELASRLRAVAGREVLPYFGGISETTKATRENDTDRVKPGITITMMDNPELDSEGENE